MDRPTDRWDTRAARRPYATGCNVCLHLDFRVLAGPLVGPWSSTLRGVSSTGSAVVDPWLVFANGVAGRSGTFG